MRVIFIFKIIRYFSVVPIRRSCSLSCVLLLISAFNGVFSFFTYSHSTPPPPHSTHAFTPICPSRSHAKFSGFLCSDKEQKTRRWLPAKENLCMLHNFGLYYFSVGQWHAQRPQPKPKPKLKTKKPKRNYAKKSRRQIKRRQKGDCNSIWWLL